MEIPEYILDEWHKRLKQVGEKYLNKLRKEFPMRKKKLRDEDVWSIS